MLTLLVNDGDEKQTCHLSGDKNSVDECGRPKIFLASVLKRNKQSYFENMR